MLIPRYPTPEGRSEGEYLRALAEEGLRAPLRRPGAARGRASGWRWSSA
ncbi:MAG: hypothetical protein WKF40_04750 [Thermoleophilaceae bacterium]